MSAVTFVKEGTEDGWNYPMREGWYFYGEDDGATMYGPYKDKETAEVALKKYTAVLDKMEIQDIYNEEQDDVNG
jgi:hypothetical protein